MFYVVDGHELIFQNLFYLFQSENLKEVNEISLFWDAHLDYFILPDCLAAVLLNNLLACSIEINKRKRLVI